jgi:hypothetical protein
VNSVFISYSKDRPRRAALYFALRDFGLNPWRDVDRLHDGDLTTDVIEAELGSCSGVILWVNEWVFGSSYVQSVELPAIARAVRGRGIRLFPVIDGLDPDEASRRLSEFGLEIADVNWHVVDPSYDDDATAARIAERFVAGHLADARRDGKEATVRLVSYDDTAPLRDEAILNFDWRHHVAEGRLSSRSELLLRAALTVSTAALKATFGACEVMISAKSHLPLAVALGHAFAEPTGCTLAFMRGDDRWMLDRSASAEVPLHLEEGLKGPIDAGAASVEVSVTRDVEPGVNAYVATGRRYRRRLMLRPGDGPERASVRSDRDLSAWSRQIGESLILLAGLPEVHTIDVFLATPVELAVAVGWWGNALGPVEVMNWFGKNGPYERMWSLP